MKEDILKEGKELAQKELRDEEVRRAKESMKKLIMACDVIAKGKVEIFKAMEDFEAGKIDEEKVKEILKKYFSEGGTTLGSITFYTTTLGTY